MDLDIEKFLKSKSGSASPKSSLEILPSSSSSVGTKSPRRQTSTKRKTKPDKEGENDGEGMLETASSTKRRNKDKEDAKKTEKTPETPEETPEVPAESAPSGDTKKKPKTVKGIFFHFHF